MDAPEIAGVRMPSLMTIARDVRATDERTRLMRLKRASFLSQVWMPRDVTEYSAKVPPRP